MVQKVILVALVAIHVFMAHYALPQWNNSKDFLFFSTWSLFANGIHLQTFDITWDKGETFLLRDYQTLMTEHHLDKLRLYRSIQSLDVASINTFHLQKIKDFCKCEHPEIARLQGSLYEHFMLKKTLPTNLTPL